RSGRYGIDHPRGVRLDVPGDREHVDRREGGEGNLATRRAEHGRGRAAVVSPCHPAGGAALHPHRLPAGARASLAHPRGGGDARRSRLGPRLAHLRRARVSQHRCHARRHRGDRRHRVRAGEARIRAPRAVHRGALGNDDGMKALISVLITLLIYEAVARSGWFASALVPTLPTVVQTLWTMLIDGTMAEHALNTLARVFAGLAFAAVF